MQPHNEFRIHPQIVQIGCYWGDGGQTEVYLVQGDTLAIVDTGINDTPTTHIAPALAVYGLKLSDIDLIIHTHGHYDHTGGNGEMVAASGAKIWVHEADARFVEDLDFMYETFFTFRHVLVGRKDRLPAARAMFNKFAGQSTKVERKFKDGEVLDLGKGVKFRVVSIPGHTMGSVALYLENDGIAIIGDSIMGMGPKPGGLPLIFYPAVYEKSIQRMKDLNVSVLANGHHYRTKNTPPDSVHFGKNVRAYLDGCQEINSVIGDSMRRAKAAKPGADFYEVAKAATDIAAERLPIVKGEEGLPVTGTVESFHGYWQLLK